VAEFIGSMSVHADLAIGYDTLGLRQFKDSGYSSRAALANGFFLFDRVDGQKQPSVEGTDADEMTLTASIAVGPTFDVPGLEVFVGGDIMAQIKLDLPDTSGDGRARFDELASCGINVEGDLTAGLTAKIVLEIPFAQDITLFKKTLARATLLEFGFGCIAPDPLAVLQDGVLKLNVGPDGVVANERVSIAAAQDANGQPVIRVGMFGATQDFPQAQVQKIMANFADGDDSIYIDPSVTIPAEIFGGAGKDNLSGGAGEDYLQGNRGNDDVFGGDGNDRAFGDHETDSAERGNDQVQGGAGNDTLAGGPGADTMLGSDGDDTLRGDTTTGVVPACTPVPCAANADDDVIYGDAGNDILEGGVGADQLHGSEGNDTLYGQSIAGTGDDARGDQLFGEAGDDQLFGQNGADSLQGDVGNDLLFGGNDADTLRGNAGVDSLRGGAGNDQLFGGTENDLLEGEAGADILHGDQHDDLLFGHSQSGIGDDAASDTLFGDQGRDTLNGDAGNDALHGGANNDLLHGGLGGDTLEGDAGTDELHGNEGNDLLFGHSQSGTGDDAATDTLFGEDGSDTAYGNAGDDLLHGGNDGDVLYGNAGSDLLEGNAGGDTMFGGAGTDQLFGHSKLGTGDDNAADVLYGDFGAGHVLGTTGDPLTAGRDELFGQGGNDSLRGEQANDELHGGAGADSMHGGTHDDLLYGDADNDTMHGDDGADQLFGDDGEDQLHGGAGNDLLVAGAGVINRIFGDDDDDRLIGSDEGADDPNLVDGVFFGDLLFGGAGDDEIFGLGGADQIDGEAGEDWIDGGARGDFVRGGTGRDTVYGGQGTDILDGNEDNDQLYGEQGSDTLRGDAGDDYLDGGVDADSLSGGTGNDEVAGGGGVGDQLFGDDGSDVLVGSDDGADIMQGGAGRDRLMGQRGNDTLRGGSDDDILLGGPGDDLLEGETGSDTLVGEADHDTLHGHSVSGAGDDNAVDFLYGDFATNDDEAGSGRDRLFGGGGNDFHFGEGGDDFIDVGAGTNNASDFGAGDGATPNAFVPPTPTPPPAVVAHVAADRTLASLPTGVTERGRWQQYSGSATGLGMGGNLAGAIEPDVAVSPTGGLYSVWSDARNGNYEIYAAQWNGSGWQGLAGSDRTAGVSNTLASSRRPSLAINTANQPVIAWAENNDIFVAQFDPAANGGAGAWTALGNSLSAGGISGTANADQPIIVQTTTGPAVAWLNKSGGVTEIRVGRWNGAAWVAVGPSVVTSAADLQQLAFTTDGTKFAVAWSQFAAGVSRVYALEFAGSSWQPLAGSANVSGISTNTLAADQPAIAYQGGALYSAWRQFVREGTSETEIYASRFSGAAWTKAGAGAASGLGLSNTNGTASRPRLAAGGGTLHLAWVEELLASGIGTQSTIYAKRWNGTAFVESFQNSGDVAGGITATGDGVRAFSFTATTNGKPFVAWETADAGSPQVYVRGDTLAVGRVMYASAAMPLQSVLELNTITPGDVIVVTPGAATGGATLTAAHSGIHIVGAGAEHSQINGLLTLNGANNVTIARVDLAVGVIATGGNGLEIASSRIGGAGLQLDGTNGARIHDSTIVSSAIGILLDGNVNTLIANNTIHGATAGVRISAVETGLRIAGNDITFAGTGIHVAAAVSGVIEDNEIQGNIIGVDYDAAAEFGGNRIHHSATGVRVAASQVADGFGYVGARRALPAPASSAPRHSPRQISFKTTRLALISRERSNSIVLRITRRASVLAAIRKSSTTCSSIIKLLASRQTTLSTCKLQITQCTPAPATMFGSTTSRVKSKFVATISGSIPARTSLSPTTLAAGSSVTITSCMRRARASSSTGCASSRTFSTGNLTSAATICIRSAEPP
jgi:Ca2+-binding RTX toxin-like protein